MIKRILTIFVLSLVLPVMFAVQVHAEPAGKDLIKTYATHAIVIDYETGMTLFEKNAEERMPTSSMSKVMTMYMVFDALKRGDISLEDEFLVSEKAWRKGGSKMFVEVDKYVKIEDLIRGVIIQSGNDASIVLAEGLAGSEKAFVNGVNAKAEELGMEASHFMNASGWPDPNHYSTARDLSTLGHQLIKNFPEYYGYYGETEYTYNNITQKNRNPLLYRDIGADGIKTGHTEAGGYGLIGSGRQDGRRVILVINGLDSNKARAQESAKLMEWGLKRFENKKLFVENEIVETADVVFGTAKAVPLKIDEDVLVTIPKVSMNDIDVTVKFNMPLRAPIEEGQAVGELTVDIPHVGKQTYSVSAAQAVAELGFFAKTINKAKSALGQSF